MKKLITILLAIILATSGTMFWKSYNSLDRQLIRKAESGTPVDAYVLGDYYFFGNEGKADLAKARTWFLAAAKGGHQKAQFIYGYMLFKGKGGAVDLKGAEEWFRAAADGGNPDAMYFLGGMHEFGKGVAENQELAEKWYREGAEAGQPWCEYQLAMKYGFRNDLENFLKWLNRSSRQGYKEANMEFCRQTGGRSGWLEQDRVAAYRWCSIALNLGAKDAKVVMDSLQNELTPEVVATQQQAAQQFLKEIPTENGVDQHIQ